MHIFIDESGTFTGYGASKPAVSTLGALIIASHRLPKLSKKYKRLRANLPKRKEEVKGSLLNESQVVSVIDILRKNGALFCASMIDMSVHTAEDIARHRTNQIASLAANLTNGHTQELRDSIAELQERMKGFSDQLYVQGAVTIDLLHQVMQDMIVYHCQRFPKELGKFHWVVDAKDTTGITNWEDWWSKTLVVWLQSMSLQRPGALLPDGDYRHFRRFIIDDIPEYLRDVAPPVNRKYGAGVDLQKMYRESFRFSSEPEPGLELVDIVTNALRRGLVGNLGEAGWLPLRGLMIHKSQVYVNPVGFLPPGQKLTQPLQGRMNKFRAGGRIMATPNLKWPDETVS
ncbi:DUF3800 domain-containing protein [Ruegeria arenilitoris]|uniref:DUF3800 domain-containing protein n=1 Tax=Ruegeria arenilitoris TaxID=1173585 RepID=UPI00147B3D08|nr:DUF3800 domain-containing protein [Ruegeria arenilitoris]